MKVKKGEWYSVKQCPECEMILDEFEIFYSGGICPHCGRDSHGTVTDTVTYVKRDVFHRKYFLGFVPYWQKVGIESFQKLD